MIEVTAQWERAQFARRDPGRAFCRASETCRVRMHEIMFTQSIEGFCRIVEKYVYFI